MHYQSADFASRKGGGGGGGGGGGAGKEDEGLHSIMETRVGG